jgi:hypothetical protein
MVRNLDDTDDRIAQALLENLHRAIDVLRPSQGRCGLEDDDRVGSVSRRTEERQRVLQDRECRGVVRRQLRGPHERNFDAGRPARVGDLVVIGRQNGACETLASARRVERVGDERLAGQRIQILSRN